MEKKFELTNETMEFEGHTLHRIKSLRNFSDVRKGDLGGWIEKEENLSHNGTCWVFDNSKVFGDSHVIGHGRTCGFSVSINSIVSGLILDNAIVTNSLIMGKVFENARVRNSITFEFTEVYGDALIADSMISGDIKIYDKAIVKSHKIFADARNVTICGHTKAI